MHWNLGNRSVLAAMIVVGMTTAAAAQGRSRRPSPPPTATGPTCPDLMQDVRITTEQVADGIAIEATTPGDPEVLRLRLRQVATLYDQLVDIHAAGAGPVEITVHDVARGGRVIIIPQQKAEIDVVRRLAGMLQDFWKASGCQVGPSAPAPKSPGAAKR